MYVCMSGLVGNVIFPAPIYERALIFCVHAQSHSSCVWASILQIFCPSVCRSGYKRQKLLLMDVVCHPCFKLFLLVNIPSNSYLWLYLVRIRSTYFWLTSENKSAKCVQFLWNLLTEEKKLSTAILKFLIIFQIFLFKKIYFEQTLELNF